MDYSKRVSLELTNDMMQQLSNRRRDSGERSNGSDRSSGELKSSTFPSLFVFLFLQLRFCF
jgi:hypothetical protein